MMEADVLDVNGDSGGFRNKVSIQHYDDVTEIKEEPCPVYVCEDNINLNIVKCEEDENKPRIHQPKQKNYNFLSKAGCKIKFTDTNNKYLSAINFNIKREPIILLQRISEENYNENYLRDDKSLLKHLVPKIKKESTTYKSEALSDSLLNDNKCFRKENQDSFSSVSDISSQRNKNAAGAKSTSHNRRKNKNTKREDKYHCHYCSKAFHEKSSLIYHLETHQSTSVFKCDQCGKCLASERLLNRHLLYHRKMHKCLVCEKFFAFKSKLNTHMSTHSTDKTFKCKECGKLFVSNNHLYNHTRIVHLRKKCFKCAICDKCYTTKSHLSDHLFIHTGVKKFKCKNCNKCFSLKSGLIAHSATHKNVKDFQCEICRNFFSLKSNLVRHLKIHSSVKLHKCDICGKCFTENSTVKRHKSAVHCNSYIRYKCDICGANYNNKRSLSRHFKVYHREGKMFECEICKKSFFEKNILTSHLMYHSRERNYKCKFCDKAYMSSGNLSEHVNRVHKSKS